MISRHFETIKNQDEPFKFIIARFLMRTNLCKFFKIKQNAATKEVLSYWKDLFDKNLKQKLKEQQKK